jgi:drug/metabolite transporter (DMT)-like permease
MVIKIGLWTLPPFLSAGLRFFLAFIFLSLYAVLLNLRFPKGYKVHFFFLGFGIVNFTGGYALVYWGEKYIASGLASVLFSVMPFYVLLLSIWLLPQEKISITKALGVLLGFAGVILIFWDQLDISNLNSDQLYGMLAVVIAPLFSSLGTITGKKASIKFHPIVLLTLPMCYAALSFFGLSLLVEVTSHVKFDFTAIFSIVYLAFFGTAIAFVLFFWMLKNTSAVLMSMITFITPPVALLWGWLILDEPITYFLVLGLSAILMGISIVRKSK